MLGVRVPCVVEQASVVVHVSGDGLAEVGGFGEAASPVGARRAELGRAQQFADGAHGVTAPQVDVRDALQQRGDILVRSGGGLGEMPGAAGDLFAVIGGQSTVDSTPLIGGGQINDRRTDQRMPERDPAAAVVEPDEPGPFGRSQRVRRPRDGDGVEGGQVASAVEDGGEQQLPGLRWQRLQPGGERRLEPAG